MITLRPYQTKAVNEALAYFQRCAEGVLLQAPVGSGKTTMGMEIVHRLVTAGKRCAWFTHRVELGDQASARADLYGIPHGRIMPGHEVGDHPFYIASIDTITARFARMKPWLESLDFAAFDESHHIVATGWSRVADAMTRAQKLGLTATPYRLDGKGLGDGGHFTQAVRCPSLAALTDQGYLAPAVVYAPPTDLDLSKVSKRGGDYALGEMAAAVAAAELSIIGRRWYAKHAPGQPAIVFCPTVEAAENSAATYRAAGWRSVSVDGTMAAGERARSIQGLADGSVQVLTSCALVGEGLDCPAVAVAILERPTASTSLFEQQIGRSLRTHPDKSHATILDLVGNYSRHGMHDAERSWSLTGGVKGVERAVSGTWRCRRCYRVHGKPSDLSLMHCPCGGSQTVNGFNTTGIDSLPPIAGVKADEVLRMPWAEALRLCKTRIDLIAFAHARAVSGNPIKNPDVWAAMVMQKRDQYRNQYARRRA